MREFFRENFVDPIIRKEVSKVDDYYNFSIFSYSIETFSERRSLEYRNEAKCGVCKN